MTKKEILRLSSADVTMRGGPRWRLGVDWRKTAEFESVKSRQ